MTRCSNNYETRLLVTSEFPGTCVEYFDYFEIFTGFPFILFQEVRNVKNVDAGDPEFETILSLVVHLYPPSHWNSIKAPTGGGKWEFLWNIPLEFYCSVNVNLILSSGKTWIIFLSSQFTSISTSAYKSASSKYALEVDLIGIHNWLHFECWQWFYFIFIFHFHFKSS